MSARISAEHEPENARLAIVRGVLADWRFRWLVLLLPLAFLLPAFPIDETRYLAVAWEMYVRQDYLVLHLNGAPYPDKGPFLFWLIDVLWLVFKPNLWSVRVVMLLTLLLCTNMVSRLAARLGGSPRLAQYSALLFAGMLYSSFFAEAVMFDVVLTAFVLGALHGALDLDTHSWGRGMSVLAIAGGFGVLTKGPVALLPISMVLFLAPYWSNTARTQRIKWYGASVFALLGSIAIALAWAIPAAKRGGPDYAQAIFLGQTTGRVAHSFAHARAFWWYVAVLPLITLPWSLSVRGSFFHRTEAPSQCTRFAAVWFVPSFAAFCLISGKQAHYLLPLMPAIALYLAQLLDAGSARIDGRAFAWLLVLAAALLLVVKQLSPSEVEIIRAAQEASLLWAAGLAALGLLLLTRKDWRRSVFRIALASTATASLCMFAATQVYAPRVDVVASAERIRTAQTHHLPIAFLGLHQGLFELAGRLVEPLEQISGGEVTAWCTAHPSGELVTFYSKYAFATPVAYAQPLAFGSVRFWDASELCVEINLIGEIP